MNHNIPLDKLVVGKIYHIAWNGMEYYVMFYQRWKDGIMGPYRAIYGPGDIGEYTPEDTFVGNELRIIGNAPKSIKF